jgi:2-keto-3-deoxy-L-fuconate dehydrogenase
VLVDDLSERTYQLEISGGQWSKGKSLRGFTPTGPVLVTPDELDHRDLRLRSFVNGEARQDSSTRDMIFGVEELVHDLSQYMELEPGDLIITGTPEGVGLSGRFPYLTGGDVVEVEIEGLGRQRHRIVRRTADNGGLRDDTGIRGAARGDHRGRLRHRSRDHEPPARTRRVRRRARSAPRRRPGGRHQRTATSPTPIRSMPRSAAAADALGGIDILVNNAGIGAQGDIAANSDAEWRRVLEINVLGIARVTRAALPSLRASAHAAIVNTSSIAATAGLPQRALYSASKGAVHALTLAMAADHLHEGIRVNAVAPGTADTPWVGRLLDSASDPAAERAALEARQPHGRLVSAEEIAAAIAYLASPASGSTAGVVLHVDGGMDSLRLRPGS